MELQPDKPDQVCAIVVTYHPQPSVADNVQRLRSQFAQILVVDNGSGVKSGKVLSDLENLPGVHLIRNPKNLGIAAALNIGIQRASTANFNWVATFDQDSAITPNFKESMFAVYESCPFKEQVALISPVYCVSEAEWKRKNARTPGLGYTLIRAAMTSGSIIKIRALLDVGLYDEGMFIDYVDFDLCLRLWRRGYKLICSRRSFLVHHLGSPEDHSFFGFPITIISHSPTRRYYILRNRLLMYRRYALVFPLWVVKDIGWLILEFTKILIFEADKRAKLSRAFKGIRDGLAGVSGPLAQTDQ